MIDATRRGVVFSALGALSPTLAARENGCRQTAPARLAASWQAGSRRCLGVLREAGGALAVASQLEIPTRAHAVFGERTGSIVAVARRPGDWLVRWWPGSPRALWVWADSGRTFNGHIAASRDGRMLYTTETAAESGDGFVSVRDAKTLRTVAEWPTHGIDPHAVLVDGGRLLIANGGIVTRPETGRVKHELDRMDSSLVARDATDGRWIGQWRLADRRLGIRHLARSGRRIGAALQAEHDDPDARAAAPLLAVLEGDELTPSPVAVAPLAAGYAGDIARCGAGFALSAPRAGAVWIWQPGARAMASFAAAEACALAASGEAVAVGGWRHAVQLSKDASRTRWRLPGIRLDNHWQHV